LRASLLSRRRLLSIELVLGSILLALMLGGVLLSGWLFPDGGEAMDLRARLLPPFVRAAHPLGTDPLGRDMLARVFAGGWISFAVGFWSVVGGAALGTLAGLVAGYYRGVAETLLMRFADVQLALPFILLAITFAAIVGSSVPLLIVLMIVSQWVQYARVVRGSVLSLREREFIQASRAFGLPDLRILFVHVLPNAFGPVMVLMTLNVANNILLESSLTFLGLGVNPLVPSWGGMLADGRTYMQTAWWITVFPGVAIMMTVLGLNLVGDWLRDNLDPTSKLS
jgi:peptide/nickel transport system permease protein